MTSGFAIDVHNLMSVLPREFGEIRKMTNSTEYFTLKLMRLNRSHLGYLP